MVSGDGSFVSYVLDINQTMEIVCIIYFRVFCKLWCLGELGYSGVVHMKDNELRRFEERSDWGLGKYCEEMVICEPYESSRFCRSPLLVGIHSINVLYGALNYSGYFSSEISLHEILWDRLQMSMSSLIVNISTGLDTFFCCSFGMFYYKCNCVRAIYPH